jgi:lysophospholipase L1-like esterase
MRNPIHIILLSVALMAVMAWCIPPAPKIRVWMIGDSTMCMYETNRAPLAGWGMPFAGFFDSTVKIENRARGGRSTRTFISENRWQAVADSLQEGDYVLIQFGHNDEAKEEKYKDRYTPVPDYKNNLTRFVNETRAKKAIPVLITPVTRMNFDKENNIKETHKKYSAAVWEVGNQQHVTVIDLDARSRELLQRMGPANSRLLFMQLDSAEHPNYPTGQKDNTHFNEYGARLIAEIVLKEIQKLEPSLADRIIKPVKK